LPGKTETIASHLQTDPPKAFMNKPEITIYTPESSLRNPAHMVRAMFRDLLSSRELAWQLALRDIKAQYR
jgi:lipopolysaccharide transport system permease protein